MPSGRKFSSIFNILAVMLAAAVLSAGAVFAGDSTSAAANKSAPLSPGQKSSELSPSALGMNTDKSKGYEPGDEGRDIKFPDAIQFGDNTLHFDANKKDPVPPVGYETNEQTVINKGQTEPRFKPSYLGLRLTTPFR